MCSQRDYAKSRLPRVLLTGYGLQEIGDSSLVWHLCVTGLPQVYSPGTTSGFGTGGPREVSARPTMKRSQTRRASMAGR